MLKSIIVSILFFQHAFAADLSAPFKITTGEIPPYTMHYDPSNGKVEGIFGEVVLSALEKAGLASKVKTEWYPWKRAQDTAQKEKNTIIFPLTRTEAREHLYKWVSLIITVNCHAFSLKPEVNVSSLSDLKKYKLGALAGSPPEVETKKLMGEGSETFFYPGSDEITNWKKLSKDRIDIWITQDVVAAYIMKEEKIAEKEERALKKGLKIFSQPLWVAVNKETSDADVKVLQEAFDDFIKSSNYKKILSKYVIE